MTHEIKAWKNLN